MKKFQSLDIEYSTINRKYAALLKRTLSNDIPFIGQIKNVICLSGLVVVNIVTFGLISLIGKQRSNIEKVFNQHPSVKWHIVIAS